MPTDWRTNAAEKRRSILVVDQTPASHPNAHPSTSVAHSEKPQTVLCDVILNLTEAKLGFLKVSTPMVSHVNGGNILFDLAIEIPHKA